MFVVVSCSGVSLAHYDYNCQDAVLPKELTVIKCNALLSLVRIRCVAQVAGGVQLAIPVDAAQLCVVWRYALFARA